MYHEQDAHKPDSFIDITAMEGTGEQNMEGNRRTQQTRKTKRDVGGKEILSSAKRKMARV